MPEIDLEDVVTTLAIIGGIITVSAAVIAYLRRKGVKLEWLF